jgi:hypothetical protein
VKFHQVYNKGNGWRIATAKSAEPGPGVWVQWTPHGGAVVLDGLYMMGDSDKAKVKEFACQLAEADAAIQNEVNSAIEKDYRGKPVDPTISKRRRARYIGRGGTKQNRALVGIVKVV